MTDTKTNEAPVSARDAKGNLIPKEVWLTCGDLPGHDHPYLMSVSAKPWDAAYDAQITKWASNVRYVPADMLADMTLQRDGARRLALMEAAKIAESRIGIYETMRQNPVFAGMVPMFDVAEDEQRVTADAIRALAEGAKP